MSRLTQSIENKIKKDVEELGYEIEYVEYVNNKDSKVFRVVIDKKDTSLTTEDCETVSRKIEDIVDSNITGDDSYILEVSSPGLERELKNTRLYNKYLESEILVKLYKRINNKKELTGVLKQATDDYILLLVEDEMLKIERNNIVSANTIYEF